MCCPPNGAAPRPVARRPSMTPNSDEWEPATVGCDVASVGTSTPDWIATPLHLVLNPATGGVALCSAQRLAARRRRTRVSVRLAHNPWPEQPGHGGRRSRRADADVHRIPESLAP